MIHIHSSLRSFQRIFRQGWEPPKTKPAAPKALLNMVSLSSFIACEFCIVLLPPKSISQLRHSQAVVQVPRSAIPRRSFCCCNILPLTTLIPSLQNSHNVVSQWRCLRFWKDVRKSWHIFMRVKIVVYQYTVTRNKVWNLLPQNEWFSCNWCKKCT